MNEQVADALVAYRYITEKMGDISLVQVENLKKWGFIPEGVKKYELRIDVDKKTVVYILSYGKGKRPAAEHTEIFFKPLSKAAQLLLGETWEIAWYRGEKKLIYREARRKPLVEMK